MEYSLDPFSCLWHPAFTGENNMFREENLNVLLAGIEFAGATIFFIFLILSIFF